MLKLGFRFVSLKQGPDPQEDAVDIEREFRTFTGTDTAWPSSARGCVGIHGCKKIHPGQREPTGVVMVLET